MTLFNVFSSLQLSHLNNKQMHQKHLFHLRNILRLILQRIEAKPHCNYLQTYFEMALDCLSTKSCYFNRNKVIITITDKKKLKRILSFLSRKECFDVHDHNIIKDLCLTI